MRTRRPNMLVYNDWLKECVKLLSRSPIESDRRFAAWFELQKITDEALASFGLDDTSSTAPLTENRVNSVLRLFDQKMEDWKEDVNPDYLTGKKVIPLGHFDCSSAHAKDFFSPHGPRISLYRSLRL